MLHGLFIASLIYTGTQLFKEQSEPVIPAANWENKELIRKDRASGISEKEFRRNLVSWKYIINKILVKKIN